MSKADAIHGTVLDTRITFTLREFSRACSVEESLILEMVEEGIIEPVRPRPDLLFHGGALVRAQRALRLVRDLGVNWPGAALALDLVERLERIDTGARRIWEDLS